MPTITLTPEMARLLDQETSAAIARADQAERCLDQHGYGCARAECGRGPATSAAPTCPGRGRIHPIDDQRGPEYACATCFWSGPATSADLLELDAVPEPVDSDAPAAVHARTLARARP